MDERWSYYQDKKHQLWLWWAIDHDSGEALAYWFGSRKHQSLDQLLELLKPLKLGSVVERLGAEVLTAGKKNTQQIERKHLFLRTWCARLVRKGIRFSKTARMHKIVVGLVITVRFFGNLALIQ